MKASTLSYGFLGIFFGFLTLQHFFGGHPRIATPTDVDFYANDTTVTVHGVIVDAPDIRPTVTKYTVRADSITFENGSTLPIRGKVLANDMGGWPEYEYGNVVQLEGKLMKPGIIDDFAYDEYLSVRGIYAIMQRAHIEKAEAQNASHSLTDRFFRSLYGLRESFEYQINRIFPEPHASLLAGLLTGSRRGIPKHLTEDFQAAGITHIIAISGYNVTIILSLLSGLLFWLPLKKRFPFLVTAIVMFTIFVGASASVVRASIMGILGLLALQTGRQTTVRLSILWTAFFMLLWNPLYLWYDAGFQLSFLAVIGIAELSSPLKKLMKFVPETFALRESLVATLAAQIATLPLTIVLFKQISVIAPLTNLLVAPLLPLAMLTGFVATMLGMVWLPLGLLIGYLCFALLHAIIWIAQIASSLPFSVLRF